MLDARSISGTHIENGVVPKIWDGARSLLMIAYWNTHVPKAYSSSDATGWSLLGRMVLSVLHLNKETLPTEC